VVYGSPAFGWRRFVSPNLFGEIVIMGDLIANLAPVFLGIGFGLDLGKGVFAEVDNVRSQLVTDPPQFSEVRGYRPSCLAHPGEGEGLRMA